MEISLYIWEGPILGTLWTKPSSPEGKLQCQQGLSFLSLPMFYMLLIIIIINTEQSLVKEKLTEQGQANLGVNDSKRKCPLNVAPQTAETHTGWTCRQCGVSTPKQDIFITPFVLFLLVAVINTGQKQLGEGRVYLAKIHSPSLRGSGQGLGDGVWGQNWATENSPHCLLPCSMACSAFLTQPRTSSRGITHSERRPPTSTTNKENRICHTHAYRQSG